MPDLDFDSIDEIDDADDDSDRDANDCSIPNAVVDTITVYEQSTTGLLV